MVHAKPKEEHKIQMSIRLDPKFRDFIRFEMKTKLMTKGRKANISTAIEQCIRHTMASQNEGRDVMEGET